MIAMIPAAELREKLRGILDGLEYPCLRCAALIDRGCLCRRCASAVAERDTPLIATAPARSFECRQAMHRDEDAFRRADSDPWDPLFDPLEQRGD